MTEATIEPSGKVSKATRARELLAAGVHPREAAALLGANLQYMYDIKSKMNREAGKPKLRGRKPKAVAAVAAAPEAAPEVPPSISLKQQLEAKTALLVAREQEVSYLSAVVAYLESRLRQHGIAV